MLKLFFIVIVRDAVVGICVAVQVSLNVHLSIFLGDKTLITFHHVYSSGLLQYTCYK